MHTLTSAQIRMQGWIERQMQVQVWMEMKLYLLWVPVLWSNPDRCLS